MATVVVGGLIVTGAAAAGTAGVAAAIYKHKKWKEVKNATIIGSELANMRSVFFEDELLILVNLCCVSLEASIDAMTAFTSRDITGFNEKEVEKMIKQFEGDKPSRKKVEKMFRRKQENPICVAAILDRFFVCLPLSLFEDVLCKDFIKAQEQFENDWQPWKKSIIPLLLKTPERNRKVIMRLLSFFRLAAVNRSESPSDIEPVANEIASAFCSYFWHPSSIEEGTKYTESGLFASLLAKMIIGCAELNAALSVSI